MILNNPKKLKNVKKYAKWLLEKYPVCQICEDKQSIEAHHLMFGCYGANKDDRTLIAVCRECHMYCHANKHESQKEFKELVNKNYKEFCDEQI